MTPERWRQIEKLYHSAREHGPAVLEGTDPELRREVEVLLAQDSGGKILDRPIEELLTESATLPMPGPDSSWTGRTISHYRILERLGAGGMGVVYKAMDTKLGRPVALKFLPPHLRHDQEFKRRLTDEARAASALDHPNIVVIHEINETPEGDLFIAMALHEGGNLRERMAAAPLSIADALQIGRQIASGLARAHEHGIYHRDIKPANIIVARDGVARIIDFGLAKRDDATMTADGSARGTPLYMSPEQASGKPVDFRTDLWSLGAVLFQMLSGKPPFSGDSQLQVMHAIVHDPPPRLRDVRPDLPAELDAIVSHAMEKDPAKRYQSAAEMMRDLSAALDAPSPRPARPRTAYAVVAACLILLVAAGAFWLYRRSEQRHWAREQAMPQIASLATKQPVAAFLLVQQAEQILPGDPQLEKLAQSFTRTASIDSTPEGAKVEIQDYLSPQGPWLDLGTTPIRNVRRPDGYFRWRLSRPGAEPFVGAPATEPVQRFSLPTAATPPGMVPVPAGLAGDVIDFIGWVVSPLPAFDIDKFEVSNAQYQEFVDQGGYRKREYWKEKFIQDGRELTWEQAMDLFRDPTGRFGPSTWEGGHYPPGQADYPVSGVSWYEAAAYAAFAGKSLPTLVQWYKVAPGGLSPYSINQSNFGGRGPAPVGSSRGVGPYGTYDMSGNVREWCLNAVDSGRFVLGGYWAGQTYQAFDPEALPPFDRSRFNGIRGVRNHGPLPAGAVAPLIRQQRDFAKARPVADEVFQAYRIMYSYDHTPVNPQNETVVEKTADWTRERLSIDAGYGNERLPVNLFLPKNVHPPYQAVVFFPSARVNSMPSSAVLGDMQFIDYVIQSGRALIYPIYTGTYERVGHREFPGSYGDLDRVIKDAKEVRRSVDYLETRSDIDKSKIAYLGVSQGTAEGVIFAALEDRFQAVVFLDGGFFLNPTLPAKDQVNFVTRLKKPVLMVNGRYDFTFSPERAQVPMFRMLGTPEADKRYVVFDTPHDISQKKPELSKEVLGWLDKYLGRVN